MNALKSADALVKIISFEFFEPEWFRESRDKAALRKMEEGKELFVIVIYCLACPFVTRGQWIRPGYERPLFFVRHYVRREADSCTKSRKGLGENQLGRGKGERLATAVHTKVTSIAVDPREASTVGLLRRGWDSNPRYRYRYTTFPGWPIQPLLHLSGRCLRYNSCILVTRDEDQKSSSFKDSILLVISSKIARETYVM